MDQGPLVTEQIEAGTEFLRRLSRYTSVSVALWLKGAEDGQWFLYVASDAINDTNFDVAYGEVLRLARAMPEPRIDPFQVKLVGAETALGRAAIQLQRRFPAKISTRYFGRQLGDLSVEDVYIYPPILSSAQSGVRSTDAA